MITTIVSILLVFFCGFFMTGVMRRYAIARGILDVPNARSSHKVSTPRGGGIAIVIAFFMGLIFLWALGKIEKDLVVAIIVGGGLVAGIGFWDDHGHISQYLRLLVHFCAVFLVLYWLRGSILPLQLAGNAIQVKCVTVSVTTISLVWLTNLFNFMDGIDGVAGSEAIFISASGALLAWIGNAEGQAFILAALAVATLGFLLWNWPPAKIFMGDAGSGFLGFTLGVLGYVGVVNGIPFWSWFILFGVFWVDATLTLFRRILTGDKWYEAHQSHAYQRAGRIWGHQRVTVLISLVNVFWLLPCSLGAFNWPEIGVLICAVAYLPLIIVFVALKPVIASLASRKR